MSFDQIYAKVKSSVWQAIAQSGVNLNNVPMDQQNKLVDLITDRVLAAVNDSLDEDSPAAGRLPLELDDEEKVLWEGRPFLSLVEFYTITTDRIKIVKGLLNRDVENFELIRVQDIDFSQTLSERMMGIGDIRVAGADPSNAVVILRNIKDPQGTYELLRKTWLAARKRHGLVFREEM